MPQLEELAHATEETLVDVLGFPEQEARHFAMLNEESKQRVITECRALIDMSPLERQEAFEKLRKAWPQGAKRLERVRMIRVGHEYIYYIIC